MKILKISICLFLVAFLFNSCGKDPKDEPIPGPVPGSEVPAINLTKKGNAFEAKYLDSSKYGKWVYFSFEKGAVVDVQDYENDLTWDIAFCRSAVRTNGGTSGKGKAAVYDTKKTDWDAVTSATPKAEYALDTKQDLAAYPTMPETTEQSYNKALKWVTVDMSTHGQGGQGPSYIIHKTVFVLKTANGNYAKLQVLDRYGAKGERSFLTFLYQYNADGADKFTN